MTLTTRLKQDFFFSIFLFLEASSWMEVASNWVLIGSGIMFQSWSDLMRVITLKQMSNMKGNTEEPGEKAEVQNVLQMYEENSINWNRIPSSILLQS
jgi:hypothetical protein